MVNCRVDVSHGERCLHSWVVRDDHLTSTGQELFGKCARLARFQIHVNGGPSRDGGNLVGLLIPHPVKKPDDPPLHSSNPPTKGGDVPPAQLPLVRSLSPSAPH